MDPNRFTTVKIFSATMQRDREALGDLVARYLAEHPHLRVVDKAVTQSSDRDFHCLTITLFLHEADAPSTSAK